ncbi:2-oxoacid:acceptor oxidoreductase subunit alpha [Desulfurivibrio dismutans]|uniref:2-oxoacid:acceptor oxidoreductase subunit alpha n=1 Tax=Desulfurivibrio dismutans TaxID=1398908 RepID=UPI0023DAA326|nr:2-oxoacid:acceptor oxidoreductase subunit alpha [Desulfurivibrio alkaliphilus]MDF1614385.1 2-oxoacid:acceptor oxidoreductase subunit alpha [Desulfurivibrio alkaliphilus]
MQQDIQILIGGEAGQGLVTIGQLLGKALVRAGREIFASQTYHSRVRGGHNTFAMRVGAGPFAAPRESIDILVALNAETVELHRPQLTKRALIIADAAFAPELPGAIAVPFGELGPEKLWNTAALALLGQVLGLQEQQLYQAVEATLGQKKPELLEENQEIMKKSREWAKAHLPEHDFVLADATATADSTQKRLLLNGNQAIALGALAGGLKFCAFYPMTPSTSVVLELITHAETMGCVIEQAEDEIAAINMAIGAAFAGAPAMVATSGGGFALMAEGISLAAMTETPVLTVVAQRPGPATGMPTRTEQGDLEFVLHAGHGEFPRAILAPGSIEECFTLTARALALTERSQSPVFLLTDQFLADSARPVTPFELNGITPVRPGDDPEKVATPYRRYRLTPDGLSPRLLPGLSEHLVVADSDEHDEDGHLSEDYGLRTAMVKKRLQKLELLKEEVTAPTLEGDQDALLLVCWGSSLGPVREAAAILRDRGLKVGTLHFSQVWPLLPEQFLDLLQKADRVVGVEGNATGQFARLIRRETGFTIAELINRYDGLPFTADFLLERLETQRAETGDR